MTVHFISVHFMGIFYKSLTLNPSVYGTTVHFKGRPPYRDFTVQQSL